MSTTYDITALDLSAITTADELAAVVAQLKTHAETIDADWNTIIRPPRQQAAPAAAGRYALSITMPDGTTIETAQRFPYAFCIAIRQEGAWKPKYFSTKEKDAKRDFQALQAKGGEVALLAATVNGAAPEKAPQEAPSAAQASEREASAIAKLEAGVVKLRLTDEARDEVLAEQAEQTAATPEEQLDDLLMVEHLTAEPGHAAWVESLPEITREPVEEEEPEEEEQEEEWLQNVKVLGGTAIHAPDESGDETLCGISERTLVQTDAALTCKVCVKKRRKTA
jgi:hypothetical protein